MKDNINKYNEVLLHTQDGKFQLMVDAGLTGLFEHSKSLHAHLYYELFYIDKGTMHVVFSDHTTELKENTLYVIPPNTLHYSWSEDPGLRRFSVYFQMLNPSQNSVFADHFDSASSLVFSDPSEMQNVFLRFARYYYRNSSVRTSLMSACFQEILYLIKEEILSQSGNVKKDSTPLSMASKASGEYQNYRIDEYINLNCTGKISLKELSEKVYLSERQINRILQKNYGQTFKERIIFLRMQNGIKLLLETDMMVKSIAEAIGYRTTYSFYYNFEKMFGMTPEQYRMAHRPNAEPDTEKSDPR